MLPAKTIKKLKRIFGAICFCGTVPYKRSESDVADATLRHTPLAGFRRFHLKVMFFTTVFHTIFITLRFYQALQEKDVKLLLLVLHFTWVVAFFMICWLYVTLHISRFDTIAYCNGLFQFYGSYMSMPGERMSAKWRRRAQKKPCLVNLLVTAFLVGAVLNTIITVQIFLMYKQSHEFVYSTIPSSWTEQFPWLIILFVFYEFALPGINWTLVLFFVILHLIHLFCTRDYLIMLRRNTQKRILKLDELRHHYRSIQILHNQYNQSIASYMPFELFVVISLTFAGNIGTIRMVHHVNDHNNMISIPELTSLPLISVLTGAFQIIFYQRAGDLHHLSSYFSRSVKRGLYMEKSAKMCLRSFPPLCVKVGTLVDIRKFTVVKFVGTVVVGTARLVLLLFRRNG